MGIKDLATVQAYHRDRVRDFGAGTSQALGWKNRETQFEKFAELCKLGDFTNRNVLDLGCGHGDLFAYLLERHSGIQYVGIDQFDSFLELAVQRYGQYANCRFYRGDFAAIPLVTADYVVCSGALNYRQSESGYLQQMIARFFGAARIGLGINLLRRVDFSAGILVAFDPEKVLRFCKQIASRVCLVEPSGDAQEDYYSVFLYRD